MIKEICRRRKERLHTWQQCQSISPEVDALVRNSDRCRAPWTEVAGEKGHSSCEEENERTNEVNSTVYYETLLFTRGISTIYSTTGHDGLEVLQSVAKFGMTIADQFASTISGDLSVDLRFIHRCSLPVDSSEHEPKDEDQDGLQGDKGESNGVAEEITRLLIASIDLSGHRSTQRTNGDNHRRADRSPSQRGTTNAGNASDHERVELTSCC